MLEKIGKGIKELRIKKLKLTQEEFSKIIYADRTYLSRVESGKQNITISSSKLNVYLTEFFRTFDSKENEVC